MDIFGGLWLENIVVQDKYFDLQLELFQKKYIQGIQIRVAHPSFTPLLTIFSLPKIFKKIPDDCKLFFHFGAENVGVDFGENFDECAVIARRSGQHNWSEWNKQTTEFGIEVARAAREKVPKNFPLGDVHPGYGEHITDYVALDKIIRTFREFPKDIAIENVPPVVDRYFYKEKTGEMNFWSRNRYWGFGGIPDDMDLLLKDLGDGWRCLIDFSHLWVMKNQAEEEIPEVPRALREIEYAVRSYLSLPHWPICHFSGVPQAGMLVDEHEFFEIDRLVPAIREAIASMEAVCLEIPYKSLEVAEKAIGCFREAYSL